MAKIVWDAVGTRFFETGVDRGVLYVAGHPGVAWNGLTAVSESPSGGEATPYYIDGFKYLNVPDREEYEATLEAFTYPEEFAECEGLAPAFSGLLITNQIRKSFGLSYRTKIGNDINGTNKGYRIHIVYNALAEPAIRAYDTMDDSPNPLKFNWKLTSLAPAVDGYQRSSHYIIDSLTADPLAVAALEAVLYGSESLTPRLPLPAEIFNIFTVNSSFVVVDNGDGSWTATGTEEQIEVVGTTFTIDTPRAVFIDADSYTLSSP